MTPAERRAALELEFVRLKGRQDQLDLVLAGDASAWISIVERMPDSVGEVTLDRAVAEARQGALAMTTIAKALDGTSAGQEVPEPGPSPEDQVKAARDRKLKAAQSAIASDGQPPL